MATLPHVWNIFSTLRLPHSKCPNRRNHLNHGENHHKQNCSAFALAFYFYLLISMANRGNSACINDIYSCYFDYKLLEGNGKIVENYSCKRQTPPKFI